MTSPNQSVTTPMIALDLSGTTHLSSDHNVALIQEFPGSSNLSRHLITQLKSGLLHLIVYGQNSILVLPINQVLITRTKLETVRKHLPRSSKLKGEKYRLEIMKLLEPATTARSFYTSIYNSKLVPIERARQDEFIAIGLAPNNGGN
ncbi:calcium-transporting ATPase 9, plasma membrane-type [Dorcoceras hygrometricum]|uniref:Calcium-transporting ATPase 9, plasma membrane-type n=1 Tax=Dorcoceras hygrometricum TaxID=472368 RepID=A0A2Z7ASK3_9LAMI|nr:calcium-transporting ATPase 9, plasma membrane-type [Dorcoceras hygrometricum]